MVTQDQIRVVIVDDHAMLRKGLAVFLMSYDDLKLVGEASNGKEGLALCASQHPDIVLMDLMMPIMKGITAIRLIRHDFPAIQVIALTSFGEEHLIKDVLAAGAISYLLKKSSADELANAIRATHRGVATFAPEVTDILVQSFQEPHPLFESLTEREQEVLNLVTKGMGNKMIANTLVISPYTVKSHVSSVLAKLGVTTRYEAIVRTLEHNLKLGAFYIP
ncbi:MAG TPA: response regulator transcription factor [Phototrophicaceae bacterium]|nr:response regulator transcription factor [Phototrophicaceae bacterium]